MEPATALYRPDSAADRTAQRRRGRTVVAGLSVVAAVVVGGTAAVLVADTASPPAATSAGVVASGPGPEPTLGAPAAELVIRPAAAPVRAAVLSIPAVGIDTELVDLAVDPTGALEVPPSPDVAGWFTGGVVPGEVGPTVIAGHVDSQAGPGVFHRLAGIALGAEVEVGRSDGKSVRYRVVDVQTVPKNAFPTGRVYGPTAGPELRLITCGGEFDRSARRYLRNVVVSAVLVDPA